jgi:RNA polymerase sigma-70 factor, ECF subfamily
VTHPDAGPPDDAWETGLVTRARAGDDEAFEALVRQHQDRAYHIALRMTGDPQDAQDVVQDALLRAWKALPAYRGESRFGTWLVRIVINRCHDARRAARPTLTLPDGDPRTTLPGPDTVVVAAHRADATIKALLELPFDQRAALVLYTFGDSTHAEVARILGINESAAKVRVHRARRELVDRLQEWT